MLIGGIITARATYIQDSDGTFYEFGIDGNFIQTTKVVQTSMIINKKPYKAISVLTYNGKAEVCTFDERGELHDNGSLEDAMSIMNRGGYMRRLQRRGKLDGIRYNQIVFIYDTSVDLSTKYSFKGK